MSSEHAELALITSPELNGFINGKRIRSWNTVGSDLKREIVVFASQSLGVPASMMRREEVQKPIPALGGKNLNGLYWHFLLDPERGEEDVYIHMNRKLGLIISPEDLITTIISKRKISWKSVPLESQMNLLQYWAHAMGKPASMLRAEDLVIPAEEKENSDIAGLTLSGLYNYYNTDKNRGEVGVMPYMLSSVGIQATAEDVVQQAHTPNEIFWERVPIEEIGRILLLAAEERAAIPAFMGYDDLESRFSFLNQRTLTGLRHYMNRRDQTLPQLLKEAGIQSSYDDLVQQIRSDKPVPWGRVPKDISRILVENIGLEHGLPPQMVTGNLLKKHYDFLGEKTLEGFYKYFLYHPDKPEDKSAMTFMRNELGLPPFPTLRNYRLRLIREALSHNEIIPDETNYSLDLLALARRLGNVYEQKKYRLTSEEMTNEATASIMENTKKGFIARSQFARIIHTDLESYYEEARQRFYNEVSLEKIIEDEETHEQRQDLQYISEDLVTHFDDHYSELVLDEIARLTPIQRHIAREVIFRKSELSAVALELGITDDELDEHFEDASTMISDWFYQEEELFVA